MKRLLLMLFFTHSLMSMAHLTLNDLIYLAKHNSEWARQYHEAINHWNKCLSAQKFKNINTIAYELSQMQADTEDEQLMKEALRALPDTDIQKIDTRQTEGIPCPLTRSMCEKRVPSLKKDVSDSSRRHTIYISRNKNGEIRHWVEDL